MSQKHHLLNYFETIFAVGPFVASLDSREYADNPIPTKDFTHVIEVYEKMKIVDSGGDHVPDFRYDKVDKRGR